MLSNDLVHEPVLNVYAKGVSAGQIADQFFRGLGKRFLANNSGGCAFSRSPMPQAVSRPSVLDLCERDSNRSPARLVLTFLDGSSQACPNGFTHARHRQEVKGLLNGIPIFLATAPSQGPTLPRIVIGAGSEAQVSAGVTSVIAPPIGPGV